MGIPSVFTLSGIANDFVKHLTNAFVVNYKNPEQIYEGISDILNDENLREGLIKQGKLDVTERFSLTKMLCKLELLYLKQ